MESLKSEFPFKISEGENIEKQNINKIGFVGGQQVNGVYELKCK
jgi:hypothetical protein